MLKFKKIIKQNQNFKVNNKFLLVTIKLTIILYYYNWNNFA